MHRRSAAKPILYTLIFTTVALLPVPNHAVQERGYRDITPGRDMHPEQSVPGLVLKYASLHSDSTFQNRHFSPEAHGVKPFEPLCEEPPEREVEMIRLDVTGTRFRCSESDTPE